MHAVIDTATDLPVAWTVRTASESEQDMVPGLLDATLARGFTPTVAVMDKGYDGGPTHEACESRAMHPVIPLKLTPAVKAGKDKPPECSHGMWTHAGSDAKRGASKWRCPSPYWPRFTAAHQAVQEPTPTGTAPETGLAADHHCAFWAALNG